MPLNTLRLNHQRSSHPNDRIVFIKPLPRPSSEQAAYDLADTFLRAIAAQCLPLMKKHYLSVTTLEEYEPNPEFIGRNFNNGEIIQLVLRSKGGGWVPFNMVQMVMMHELAHNTHMNHGKLFWQTRNTYADEMKALWARHYTGEGFWGSGRTLDDLGTVMGNNILSSQELQGLPLCGGTYRSRRRKRKARGDKDQPELTWKEKKDRRIERKFGKNGVALGEDEDRRLLLEINKKGPVGGKPRVAQSKRGRELRAAAALARFAANSGAEKGFQNGEDSEEDEDYEEAVDADGADAIDLNGEKILDSHGQGMVRVCEDEDTDDVNVKHEMTELENLDRYFKPIQYHTQRPGAGSRVYDADHNTTDAASGQNPDSDTCKHTARLDNHDTLQSQASASSAGVSSPSSASRAPKQQRLPSVETIPTSQRTSTGPMFFPTSSSRFSDDAVSTKIDNPKHPSAADHVTRETEADGAAAAPAPRYRPQPPPSSSITISCAICSLENPRLNATCLACAHVIDPSKDSRHWSCQSEACRAASTGYLNSGDAGLCGICGSHRDKNEG